MCVEVNENERNCAKKFKYLCKYAKYRKHRAKSEVSRVVHQCQRDFNRNKPQYFKISWIYLKDTKTSSIRRMIC